MFRVFKQMNVRNRAYVIDSKGNKLYYGTVFQCNKFISYMEEETIIYKGGSDNERIIKDDSITEREKRG